MARLFVDQITVIDFSYLDPQRGIVGESWLVDLELDGDLDEQGMVFDFGDVKKKIKQSIDKQVDHRFLIPAELSSLQLRQQKEEVSFTLNSARGEIKYQSPAEAVLLVPAAVISIQSVLPVIKQAVTQVVPDNVSEVTLTLSAEQIPGHFYHYSHGLKKHLGDCQRICHGHRSAIRIFRNDERDQELEQSWAQRWRDIYLITEEDIVNQDDNFLAIAYRSQQGLFELTLPRSHCEVLPCDSTVELIAEYIAQQIKSEYPADKISVKAYEGINKGAIASC